MKENEKYGQILKETAKNLRVMQKYITITENRKINQYLDVLVLHILASIRHFSFIWF